MLASTPEPVAGPITDSLARFQWATQASASQGTADMLRKVSTLVLPLFLALPSMGAGQQLGEIDAVTASPEKFTVLLENEHVRVVEYVLDPRERDEWHTHPPKVSYVLSTGTLRITLEDGTSFLTEERAGTAVWMDALGRHYGENVGKTPVRVLLVEVKAARERP